MYFMVELWLWHSPIMLNKVIFYVCLCIRSCCGNTLVNVDSHGHVVTEDGRDLKVNGITQEIGVRCPLKLPVT